MIRYLWFEDSFYYLIQLNPLLLTSATTMLVAVVVERSVTVGCAVAVSMKLLNDELATADAELDDVTGGCCFFFSASYTQ